MTRRGVTLLELLVVLLVLGTVASVAGLSLPRVGDDRARRISPEVAARGARHDAVTTGARVTRFVVAGDSGVAVSATPDGRVMMAAFQPAARRVATAPMAAP